MTRAVILILFLSPFLSGCTVLGFLAGAVLDEKLDTDEHELLVELTKKGLETDIEILEEAINGPSFCGNDEKMYCNSKGGNCWCE